MPVWDDDLAAKARKKARLLAQDDSSDRDLVHLGKRSNISVSAHNPSIEDAVSNEQVPDDLCLWHRTRQFGMGKAVSNSGHTYIVARYMPQGRR
ncbi:hypothetical protein AC578_7397 [Pseudocercospora eumusae]|uniref:SCP domain-containing protein n=1 Tax=Pseudocercospora eumusae TaxID=321146 RepID=A0A139H390_9PEZI|nr:hypothetical protein AC578_7397 [Pseudocercospora eumusae]